MFKFSLPASRFAALIFSSSPNTEGVPGPERIRPVPRVIGPSNDATMNPGFPTKTSSKSITAGLYRYISSVALTCDDEDRLVNWKLPDTNLDRSRTGRRDTDIEIPLAQSHTNDLTNDLLTVKSQRETPDAKRNMTLSPALLCPNGDPLEMKQDLEIKLIVTDADNGSVFCHPFGAPTATHGAKAVHGGVKCPDLYGPVP